MCYVPDILQVCQAFGDPIAAVAPGMACCDVCDGTASAAVQPALATELETDDDVGFVVAAVDVEDPSAAAHRLQLRTALHAVNARIALRCKVAPADAVTGLTSVCIATVAAHASEIDVHSALRLGVSVDFCDEVVRVCRLG